MFPLKIGHKIYIHPFQVVSEDGIWKYYSDVNPYQVAKEKGIWKYYSDSENESNSDTSSSDDNWEELK